VSTLTAKPEASPLAGEVETLFRVAYRLTGNSHDAEDLVQDVCERALRKAPHFADSLDCRRWLLRVLYNCFVDGRRHRQRSPFVAADAAGINGAARADGPGPEDLAARSDSESALMRAWASLPRDQQIILLLRAEGYDLGEIARIAEIDKPALSSRLHRARSSLAKNLEAERSAQLLCAIPE
jgi:RNA polymerase sigma-70 factor (ECF subfamily)